MWGVTPVTATFDLCITMTSTFLSVTSITQRIIVSQAARERGRLGTAPHRAGRPFNQHEYQRLRAETMIELLDPGRPRGLQGELMPEKAADDVRALEHFAQHPELQVCCLLSH